MTARRRASAKPHVTPRPGGRRSAFRAIASGLYELRIGARVVLDLLITLDGELMTFVRVDGTLIGELPVAGEA